MYQQGWTGDTPVYFRIKGVKIFETGFFRWYIAMLIPLYFLTPFYARIIDKTKYQTLLTVTLCIILLLISTIKIENNNLFSHVWNNTAFVEQRSVVATGDKI